MKIFDRVPAIDCKYGCGTRIFHNNELHIFQEEWSEVIHDKRRCWAIKEQQRREAIGDVTAPRMEVVEEMIDVRLTLVEGLSKEDQVYHMIKTRKSKEAAVTLDEIAIALDPSRVYMDKKGSKRPTPQGRISAAGAIYRARMKRDNDHFAPFALKVGKKDGLYYFWNMQTRDEFQPVKKKKERTAEQYLANAARFSTMIEIGPTQRLLNEQRMDAILNEKALRKRKRKDDGSSTTNGDV